MDAFSPRFAVVAGAFVLLAARDAFAVQDVLMRSVDPSRTGAQLEETLLTVSNVRGELFGKLFARPVTGQIYAQPLYAHGLELPGLGVTNAVIVATMHNEVSMFDADDPARSVPLWHRSLEPSVPLPDPNIGYVCVPYKDILGEIGIIGTPAIDRTAGVVYAVTLTSTRTDAGTSYAHHVHALDLYDGHERLAPVQVVASVPGTGDGSVGGNIALQSQFQNQRAGLVLANGNLYVAFGAYCDTGPYHGWVIAYRASDLTQVAAWNDTSDGWEGGIWQSGEAPAVTAGGDLVLLTGNGTTNAMGGGASYGDAFVELTPGLTVKDWFAPYNYQALYDADTDLGSAGALLLPGTGYVVGGGKEGKVYVLDGASFGHFHAGADSQIVQSFQVTSGHIHGSPVYWNGPAGPLIYLWAEQDYLDAFLWGGAAFATTPQAKSSMSAPNGMPGGILSVSANGAAPGSGIVWASIPVSLDANHAVVAGMLRAFDASDVSKEIWNSEMNAVRDRVGDLAKFCPPTVADGKVYLATFSDQLVVYGLLGSGADAGVDATSDAALVHDAAGEDDVIAAVPDAPGDGDATSIEQDASAEADVVAVAVATEEDAGIDIDASADRDASVAADASVADEGSAMEASPVPLAPAAALDSGCSCRMGAPTSRAYDVAWLALALLGGAMRRPRRRDRLVL
jgi:MYXO-CTERM domain-containing protein